MNVGYYLESDSYNPYRNLAIEEWLLEIVAKQKIPTLFLWQNDKSIIIGRNQNAYTECNIELIRKNDYLIARRNTGGGAVYHDLGNLNYSIILPKAMHEISTSTKMLVKALKDLGINAEPNGRNDICVGRSKISGNAYYSNEEVGLHHGTILLNADLDKMGKVLNIPKYKRTYKGIESTKSRVVNIQEINPHIILCDLKSTIRKAFCLFYSIEFFEEVKINQVAIDRIMRKLSSNEWIFDKVQSYNESVCIISNMGLLTLSIDFDGEIAKGLSIASDWLDTDKVKKTEEELLMFIRLYNNIDIQSLVNKLVTMMNLKDWEIRGS